jgi:DNA-binding LacI/PurR family transcriptional regulator
MGYLPSAVGRSLVTRRTRTLGVVVSTITDLFFAEVIASIEETALADGYSVILSSSGGRPEREQSALRSLRERRVDGIVLVSGCCNERNLAHGPAWDIPIVYVNNVYHEHVGYSVEVDNYVGARAAVRHLLDLGHTRIAHVAGPESEWDAIERRRGYEEGLAARSVAADPTLVTRGDSRPHGGIAAMRRLLALTPRPTALFCYNDATALGAMRAARDAGLRIPDDLSVVGFDDIDLAPFLEPALTTVAQPKREMGSTAVRMILELLEGARPAYPEIVLPSHLVVRGSTQARTG